MTDLIDAYCSKVKGFGLQQSTERHPWNQHNRHLYPYNWPIVSIDRLEIFVSNQQKGVINVGDVFVNNQQGYIEIVSLATVTYSLMPAIVSLGMFAPVAEITYTHGYGVAVAAGPLTDGEPDNSECKGKKWTSGFPCWSPEHPVVVYSDGSPLDEAEYAINYPDGEVETFDDRSMETMTADFAYMTPPSRVKSAMHAAMNEWLSERRLIADGLGGLTSATIGEYSVTRRAGSPRENDDGGLVLPSAARLLLRKYQDPAIR